MSEWLLAKRQQITSVGKNVGKRGHLCIFTGNVNWCSHYGKTVWRLLKKFKIELPYDTAIPLLGICLKKTKTLIRKDTCTLMFIAPLFTIAKMWKQPMCPSIDEWIMKMWYIYYTEHYLAIRRMKSCHL